MNSQQNTPPIQSYEGKQIYVGIDVHKKRYAVVHAAAVEVALHQRVKTDKRDAKKLASQLEAGRLRGSRVPSEVQEQRRLLSRTRAQLVKQRAAIKNQIRMKAHQFGLIEANDPRELQVRTGSTRAIVAVARKLIGRIRAAFRKGEQYTPQALPTATAAA